MVFTPISLLLFIIIIKTCETAVSLQFYMESCVKTPSIQIFSDLFQSNKQVAVVSIETGEEMSYGLLFCMIWDQYNVTSNVIMRDLHLRRLY